MNYKFPAIGLASLITVLTLACTHGRDSIDRLSVDSFTTLPIQTVFELTESDDVAFRFIRSIQIDDQGNVLINDPTQPIVFMVDAEGNLIQKIGQEGRGPGEFQNIGSTILHQKEEKTKHQQEVSKNETKN